MFGNSIIQAIYFLPEQQYSVAVCTETSSDQNLSSPTHQLLPQPGNHSSGREPYRRHQDLVV